MQLKFLVVDDALVSRKLVARLLNPVSREVQTAENGEVAVRMVQESLVRRDPFDVVLIDYNMPIMNGYDAILNMRAIRYDGFIIGVTAGGHEEVTFFCMFTYDSFRGLSDECVCMIKICRKRGSCSVERTRFCRSR